MKQKHGFIKGALTGALVMLLGMALISCSVMGDKAGKNDKKDGESIGTKVELIDQLIDNYYIGEVDEEALKEGIYKGYVQGLEDPYSVYYDQEETKALNETTSGEYGGIGALMSQNNETGLVTIAQVYEDSPAEKAGIRAEDVLYKVDGKDLSDRELEEIVGDIKGEKGTEVELTLLRADTGKEETVTVVRDIVEAQTVAGEMKEDGVGYIKITEFDSVTFDQYESALKELEQQGMEKLIVDLRGNPGGNLVTVCDILDLMLPGGTIVSVKEKSGEEEEFTSDTERQFEKPLAVLINGYSASASEIFAGAVQDYGTGTIVGTQSYGKGVVQQVFDLQDDTSLKLTIAEYYTPNGRNINGEGITPDVEVEYKYDKEHPEADNQLERAMEVLRKME